MVDNVEQVNAVILRGQMDCYCWYSWQIGHQLWICIFHHPQGPWVSQNLCKVSARRSLQVSKSGHARKCVWNFWSNIVKKETQRNA